MDVTTEEIQRYFFEKMAKTIFLCLEILDIYFRFKVFFFKFQILDTFFFVLPEYMI